LFSDDETVTITSQIIGVSGLLTDRFAQALAVGSNLEFTYTSAQSIRQKEILKLETTLKRDSIAVYRIFWDRVFKTFVFTESTPGFSESQPVITGKVTDGAGLPVPGAIVRLDQLGVEFMAVSNSEGNFKLVTAAGSPLERGQWLIRCGHITQELNVRPGPNSIEIHGVDPEMARQPV
jgi:hypothetical protein